MKYFITGGAGFLGYHLVQALAKKKEKITLYDIAEYTPGDYPKDVKCVHGDVRDLQALIAASKGHDVIIHAAAALPLWKKEDIMTTTVDGTRAVLEAAKANKIKRVVYISSTAVYGIPLRHPLVEEDPMVGVGPYGTAKIEAEKICMEYRSKTLTVPVIRPKTFIGTGRLGVFQILFDWVESGARIPVFGNGKNRYQLLDVRDLVDAILLAATKPDKKANETFNCGAENFRTVREDVGALCEFAGNGAKVLGVPSGPVKAALRVFEAMHISPLYRWVYGTADKDSFVSIDKIKTNLGWKPKYSNADALIDSYKWYLQNKPKDADEVAGVTHRVPWKQGVLKIFKAVAKII
ncbi:MAG: NAD(P)-dependent oxidoreductase [Spirochaetia bacterium]|nr:NAD(P)-dependent oxidoreductase [Spirochaetia bacterium]